MTDIALAPHTARLGPRRPGIVQLRNHVWLREQVAAGRTAKDIADELGISVSTVERERSAMRKNEKSTSTTARQRARERVGK